MFKKAKIRATLKEGVKKAKPVIEDITEEEIKASIKESFESLYMEKEKEREKEKKVEQKTQSSSKSRQLPGAGVTPARAPIERPEITPVSEEEMPAKLRATKLFVEKFLILTENDAKVIASVNDKDMRLDIQGDEVGRLIGKGGVALHALQTIVTSIAIQAANGENRRVYVNIENYKEKRTQTLQELASRKAEVVKKTGKTLRLDPMTPRERAIIHTHLQNMEGIKTFSKGMDPNRYLVIAPTNSYEGEAKILPLAKGSTRSKAKGEGCGLTENKVNEEKEETKNEN